MSPRYRNLTKGVSQFTHSNFGVSEVWALRFLQVGSLLKGAFPEYPTLRVDVLLLPSRPLELHVLGTRISALPKGLISWFLGYQYPRSTPSGSTSRSHQSPAASSFSDPPGCHSPIHLLVIWSLLDLMSSRGWNPAAGRPRVALNNVERNDTVSEPSTKRIGQSRLPRFLFTEEQTWVKVAPKPSDEGSLSRLRNPHLRDYSVSWYRQRNYKVHPYWTNNLKYVY
jgi:hypothetical protein